MRGPRRLIFHDDSEQASKQGEKSTRICVRAERADKRAGRAAPSRSCGLIFVPGRLVKVGTFGADGHLQSSISLVASGQFKALHVRPGASAAAKEGHGTGQTRMQPQMVPGTPDLNGAGRAAHGAIWGRRLLQDPTSRNAPALVFRKGPRGSAMAAELCRLDADAAGCRDRFVNMYE